MRVLALACPDWPVWAAAQEHVLPRQAPIAVLAANRVTACNDHARREGVRTQMRRRDAQATCPDLMVVPADTDRDVRAFEAVVGAIETLRPGVAPIRPGLLAVRSPARFYGSEINASAVLVEAAVETGVWDARAGIADDLTTAVQAAFTAEEQNWLIVSQGSTTDFWSGLVVEALYSSAAIEEAADITEFVGLLRRLGLRTLGQFAQFSRTEVSARFGNRGLRLHRLICGEAAEVLGTRTPPPDLVVAADFEPPLESAEALVFSARQSAERFVQQLGSRGLVCTSVIIEVESDRGTRWARTWLHSSWFTVADLIDRVHWQVAAADSGLDGALARITFTPESVEGGQAHAEALWGQGPDERIERGIAKVQALLGYEAACRPVLQGGRSPADRQALIPWGEQAAGLRDRGLPWPGSIPPPAPCRVFAQPHSSDVWGEHGQVRVDERGVLTCTPQRFKGHQGWEVIEGWAGPWPVEEAWWESEPRFIVRFQVVSAAGRAWLLRYEQGAWLLEAGYD